MGADEQLMPRKRKIAIFTGNRAEYGLQYSIIRAIASHPKLEYFLLVSGAHLQEDFGYTIREIEKDGFQVHDEVKLSMEEDTLLATAEAIGSGILSLSRILDKIRPDFLVVYADRFEGFSAVITGSQMNIATAHVEGGDITEGGALDDSVRHAMTKLSHLHFTTNQEASERVRRLGEEPWRIHNVGFPAIDLIAAGCFATPAQLEERFGLLSEKPIVIFTQHSVTTEFEQATDQIMPSMEAMRILAEDGCQV
ncbi:MAG: UDP-N-acetylglucosamine 2-epimerase, partial [Planctomycetota bacterium]